MYRRPLGVVEKPCHQDMLRAYVINSRVEDAGRLALVQPYSPQLFRQGNLPGPTLLLEVLTNVKNPKEAQKLWHEYEMQKEEKSEASGSTWTELQQGPAP